MNERLLHLFALSGDLGEAIDSDSLRHAGQHDAKRRVHREHAEHKARLRPDAAAAAASCAAAQVLPEVTQVSVTNWPEKCQLRNLLNICLL